MSDIVPSGVMDKRATLYLEHWSGRMGYSVRVYGETPKRYRCEVLENLPIRNRLYLAGDTLLVPKYAIKFKEQDDEV